ncbi:MAG: hypothetical protein IH595_11070 [Bacteroidales bacterium]|nr:hypothetical protein [Bacteroidales bacterium]
MKSKATIQIHGKVAEVMDYKGKKSAKIVCNKESIIIDLKDCQNFELGSKVRISGELVINGIHPISNNINE